MWASHSDLFRRQNIWGLFLQDPIFIMSNKEVKDCNSTDDEDLINVIFLHHAPCNTLNNNKKKKRHRRPARWIHQWLNWVETAIRKEKYYHSTCQFTPEGVYQQSPGKDTNDKQHCRKCIWQLQECKMSIQLTIGIQLLSSQLLVPRINGWHHLLLYHWPESSHGMLQAWLTCQHICTCWCLFHHASPIHTRTCLIATSH